MTSSTLDKAKTQLADSTGANDDTDDQPIVETTGQAAVFDRSQYELEGLQIARVDGESIDKIRIDFSGSVMLDRSSEADVALFNRLKLGQDCELRCAGTVSTVKTGYTTSKDGDLDAVVGGKTVKVSTVWVLEAEQLAG